MSSLSNKATLKFRRLLDHILSYSNSTIPELSDEILQRRCKQSHIPIADRHQMCLLCKTIYDELDSALHFYEKDQSHARILVVRPTRDWEPDKCGLCLFLAICIENQPHTTPSPDEPFGLTIYAVQGGLRQMTLYQQHTSYEATISANAMQSMAHHLRSHFRVTFSLRPKVDFTKLRAAVHSCRAQSLMSELNPETSRGFVTNFIDCDARRVRQANLFTKYVALSYVWGPQDSNKECFKTELPPGSVPNLVEDAMEVTRKIGFRYLWIDRLCIDQNQSEEKQHQIINMHKIYGHAQVTIVVASAVSPDYRIPGMGDRPLVRIPVMLCRNTLMAFDGYYKHDGGKTVIEDSPWATRGWTYQEGIFARLRLYFTELAVFIDCDCTVCSSKVSGIKGDIRGDFDIVARSVHGFQYTRVTKTRTLASTSTITAVNTPERELAQSKLKTLVAYLSEYSPRQISYLNDRLNCVLGFFQLYQKTSPPVFHLQGLPFQPNDYSLHHSLLWTHVGDEGIVARIAGLPSWSWVGWTGAVQIPVLDSEYDFIPSDPTFVAAVLGTSAECSILSTTIDGESNTASSGDLPPRLSGTSWHTLLISGLTLSIELYYHQDCLYGTIVHPSQTDLHPTILCETDFQISPGSAMFGRYCSRSWFCVVILSGWVGDILSRNYRYSGLLLDDSSGHYERAGRIDMTLNATEFLLAGDVLTNETVLIR